MSLCLVCGNIKTLVVRLPDTQTNRHHMIFQGILKTIPNRKGLDIFNGSNLIYSFINEVKL